MNRLFHIAVFIVMAAAAVYANGEGEGAPEVPQLEGFSSATAAGVNVQWMVEGDSITVQASAGTTGWVAVGFDPTRQMLDANFIIGYVEDGELFISDDYGASAISHAHDTDNGGTNDITSAEGDEREGVTTIRFTIPLDSGDSRDRPLETGMTYKVIVAHGPNDADDFETYHASRGSFEMEL